MLLNALGGFGKIPSGLAHEKVHATAAAAGAGLATAFVAVPRAGAVLIIKAIPILAAT
jgi:hypothetical protein